ncbi:hypothetical protein CHS0354_019377 [Potamilus streckersoni]|uniref:CABIT domain-containing protein n=1 Tax=Potamilus streckersoni TaxID=2493646 RepID=A0AAE0VWY0_9BIVA|nr:hypothetical protein CHS0354_019377 [Potamilus streckersoni]
MEDLPSCVQTLNKISFVSHGVNAPVTIAQGTKLFPARNVPKNSTDTSSTNQVICILEDGREIAIPENCKARFVVVEDERKLTVKDIVEKFPLPQAVQFETVLPENVVSRDDDEACNLMYMMDGPVSVISVERMDVYVGCLSRMPGKYIPFILPVGHKIEVYASDKNEQRYLDNLYAPHLPSSLPLCLVEGELYIIDTEDLHVHYLKDIDLDEAPTVPPPRPRKSNDNAVSVLSSNAPPVPRRLKPYEDTQFPKEAEFVSDDKPNVPPKSFNSKHKINPEVSTQERVTKPLPPEPIPPSQLSGENDSSEACIDSCYEDVSSFNAETNNPPVPSRMPKKPDKMEANNTQQKKQENKKTTSSSEKPPKLPPSPTAKVESISVSKGQQLQKSSGPTLQTSPSILLHSCEQSPSIKEEEKELPDYEDIPDTIDIPIISQRKGQIRTSSKNRVSSSGSFPPLKKNLHPIDDEG